ncbi:hypothetical protein [Micromonospora sp. WMMD980]|uniref:hypothetical protein n=1 Tax=Micromonospora sp. WMMD980 TaxID=3016088 RepID=UPI002416ED56|nr:hypothetical protein [Micromonospora sp. WMMD980]MDG4799893.1 hypothetical protein [Micromonospora sp. WMMD980]
MSPLSTQATPPFAGPKPSLPREYGEQMPHTPLRPMWFCRADGRQWPCAEARLRLRAEFADNLPGLAIYLAGMQYEATRDLYHLNPHDGPSPRELFDRFVAWGPFRKPAVAPREGFGSS